MDKRGEAAKFHRQSVYLKLTVYDVEIGPSFSCDRTFTVEKATCCLVRDAQRIWLIQDCATEDNTR
jgi:hypothetical protein